MTLENLTVQDCNLENSDLIEIENEESEEITNEYYVAIKFINLKFKNNTVPVILNINRRCSLNIENSEFTDNIGNFSLIEIKTSTNLNITKSYFRDNVIMSSGTILRSDLVKDVEINILNDSFFISNIANSTRGGGVIWLSGENTILNIEESYFLRNKAVNEGGAIAISEGVTLNITDSTFMENEVMESGGGGAIYAEVTNLHYI